MSIVKGNIVVGNNSGRRAIILAVTKDGKRAKLYVYGPDREEWLPISRFTVEVSGVEQCFKCIGTGLFYMGGMVLNGRYTGKTGICYACEGKGEQTDADRIRCHYYWHRKVEAGEEVESPLDPNPQARMDEAGYVPEATPENVREWKEAVEREKPKRPKIRSKSTKKNHPDPERKMLGKPRKPRKPASPQAPVNSDGEVALIDCPNCGALHRSDIKCPW